MILDGRALSVTALILAGGKGTRVASLFPSLPKPLIPAGAQPFLFWVVSWLRRQGVADVVISAGYLGQMIADWASQNAGPGVRMECVIEQKPLGTGGALRHCLPLCGDIVVVLNGDTLFLCDLQQALARLVREELDGILFAKSVPDASRYGVLDFENGILTEMREKMGSGPGHVYGGIALFRTRVLERFPAGQPLSFETEIVPQLLAAGVRVGVEAVSAPFLDIGTEVTVRQGDAFVRTHREAFSTDWTGISHDQPA